MIGKTVSHYEIKEKLGEGGMGVLYSARDIRLDRTVAIKVLRPDAVDSEDRRQRFVQEARAASALNHPNIITIHPRHRPDQGPWERCSGTRSLRIFQCAAVADRC